MKTRLAHFSVAAALPLLAFSLFAPQAKSQALNPPYLSQMPTVQRVMSEIRGPDPRETAIRQICAFWQLQEIVKSLAGPREFRGLTPDENKVIQAYSTAGYNVEQTYENSLPTADAKKKFENDDSEFRFDRNDPHFGIEGVELFKILFTPAFHDQFNASLSAEKARHDASGKAGDAQLAQEQAKQKAAVQAQYDQLMKTPEGAQLAQSAKEAVAHGPQTEADQRQAEARRCIAAGRDATQCFAEEMSGGFKDLSGGAFSGLTPASATGLRMSGVYPGLGGFSLMFYDDTVSVGCGKIEADPHPYTVVMQGNQAQITIPAQPKPLTVAFGPDGKLHGGGAVQVTGQVVIGHKTEYEYDVRTGVRTGRTIQVPVYETQTASCTAGVMTSSGSTPAAKGVTSALSDVLGIGQTARDYTSTADTGPVPPGLRMIGTYVGQGAFSVEFHVDTVVVGCGEVAVAHPYTVAASGNQLLVKIQDAAPLLLAIRADGGLSGPTAPIAVNGRVVTGTDDNAHKVTYASKSASCAVGVLTPRR